MRRKHGSRSYVWNQGLCWLVYRMSHPKLMVPHFPRFAALSGPDSFRNQDSKELPPLQVRLICASAPSLNLFLRYHRLGRRIKCLTAVPPKNISISSVLRLHNSALLSKHSQSTSRSYSINSSSPRYSRASSLCSTSLASLPRALRRRYVHVTFSYWNM